MQNFLDRHTTLQENKAAIEAEYVDLQSKAKDLESESAQLRQEVIATIKALFALVFGLGKVRVKF